MAAADGCSGQRRLGVGDVGVSGATYVSYSALVYAKRSLGAVAHELQRALLELGRVGVLEHDLVATLAVDLVGRDVEVEELGLLLGEAVLLEQHRVLAAVDRGHLRLETDHEGGGGDGEVLADRGRRSTTPAGRG